MNQAIVDEIVSQFFSIGRRLKQQVASGTQAHSLNLQQLETLRFIAEHTRASMKEVAAFSCISPPSATILINQLVNLKLVKRDYDKKNRRNIYLILSKKGLELLNQTLEKRCQQFADILKNLNKQEQVTMLRLLQKMTV